MDRSSAATISSGVEDSAEPHTRFHSFACHVPLNDLLVSSEDANEEEEENGLRVAPQSIPPRASLPSDIAVVGTVTVLGRTTVLIWLGWGRVQAVGEGVFSSSPDQDSGASGASPSTTMVGAGMSCMPWFVKRNFISQKRSSAFIL
jgi:hypothetical protein